MKTIKQINEILPWTALVAALALSGCMAESPGSTASAIIVAEEPAAFAEEQRTFEVLDVWQQGESVIYLVHTHGDVLREVLFAEGMVTVRDADTGEWVANESVLPSRVEDVLLLSLDLPNHAAVGFEALGFDATLPVDVEPVAAPEELSEIPYSCEPRRELGCIESGGCSHCYAIDSCDTSTYVLSWQEKSGCNWFGFNCDCEGSYQAIEYAN